MQLSKLLLFYLQCYVSVLVGGASSNDHDQQQEADYQQEQKNQSANETGGRGGRKPDFHRLFGSRKAKSKYYTYQRRHDYRRTITMNIQQNDLEDGIIKGTNHDVHQEKETKRRESIFTTTVTTDDTKKNLKITDEHIYVNSETGNNANDGSGLNNAVKTLTRALVLVKNASRPLSGNLIVHLSGTFSMEKIRVRDVHGGTSASKRVIFRGDEDGSTTILGGQSLNFVKVSSLGVNHPARQLAQNTGTNIANLYAAEPPVEFSNNNSQLHWPDGDCRDTKSYASPSTLSINGIVMTRSREPNLPTREAATSTDSMGETRDTWLRTRVLNTAGKVTYKSSDTSSISKASNASWNSGAVVVHIFPLVDWYDARVQVGARSSSSNQFGTITNQRAPGNPGNGNKFKIVPESRYYLEGAVEYLDSEGEFYVSSGEVNQSSRGWTLFYPPSDVDMNDANLKAYLSVQNTPVLDVEGSDLHVTFENLRFEAARKYLGIVFAYSVDFVQCSFLNSGHDAIEVYGQSVTFRNCIFEGTGGSAIQLADDRDIDTSGKAFGLLESGNALVDSLVSDFASTCRHYSEGIHIGGYGSIVSNNHFRSSNMAAIDVVGGGFKILHNVFSHVSDGSYDDGAIHWVAESPMERGTEVGYNVFFRNGVSDQPCNANTSCYQADIYMDDMAGAMTIHGNIMIKEKVIQTKPSNSNFNPIHWVGIFVNGGADISAYENAFLGPADFSTDGAIYGDKAILYEQTSSGTIWPDGTSCGNTGICSADDFYKRMRLYGFDEDPWASAFPELLNYDATPASGSNWYCANRRSCPMAPWNNTVLCNTGIGATRSLTNRAVWPSDTESELYDEAVEGETVPRRSQALTEIGNKADISFEESTEDIDIIENDGIESVLLLARRIADEAEASEPSCNEGIRKGATRVQLAGRLNNPCTDSWSLRGMSSCDSCANGGVQCADRDMPGSFCSCGTVTPTSSPTVSKGSPPTASPSSKLPTIGNETPTTVPTPSPTPPPACQNDMGRKFVYKGKKKGCYWLDKQYQKQRYKRVERLCKRKSKFCKETCGFCEEAPNATPVPTPAPVAVNASYKTYVGKGYCDGQEEDEYAAGPIECWEKCKNQFGYVYAEFTDGSCYCQNECPCMLGSGDTSITAILPTNFQLPDQC